MEMDRKTQDTCTCMWHEPCNKTLKSESRTLSWGRAQNASRSHRIEFVTHGLHAVRDSSRWSHTVHVEMEIDCKMRVVLTEWSSLLIDCIQFVTHTLHTVRDSSRWRHTVYVEIEMDRKTHARVVMTGQSSRFPDLHTVHDVSSWYLAHASHPHRPPVVWSSWYIESMSHRVGSISSRCHIEFVIYRVDVTHMRVILTDPPLYRICDVSNWCHIEFVMYRIDVKSSSWCIGLILHTCVSSSLIPPYIELVIYRVDVTSSSWYLELMSHTRESSDWPPHT